jgi:hypothetical protein
VVERGVNAFLDETRSERLDLALPFMRQLRVSPTLAEVLAAEKPATQTWGDFALAAMVEKAVTARMVRGDLCGVTCLVVRLTGRPSGTTESAGTPSRGADGRPAGPTDDGEGAGRPAPRKPLMPISRGTGRARVLTATVGGDR